MTPQQIFDHVVPRLLKQNNKALQDDVCVLIADDGKRCAFGMLLPEDWTADNMYLDGRQPAHHFDEIGVEWISDNNTIQGRLFRIHNFNQPSKWPSLFRQAAKDFGLEWTQ